MNDEAEDLRQLSYWPSVSDLFMTLFIIAMVLVGAFFYILLPTSPDNYKTVVEAVGGVELSKIREPTNRIRQALMLPEIKPKAPATEVVATLSETADAAVRRLGEISSPPDIETLRKQLYDARQQFAAKTAEIEKLKSLISDLEKKNKGLTDAIIKNDKPPIIKIAESGKDGKNYHFEKGKAVVSKEFMEALRTGGFSELKAEILERNAVMETVDTMEIIGHTDGVIVTHPGNLDQVLPQLLAYESKRLSKDYTLFEKLVAGSNNDLGLLRALAIKREWMDYVQKQPEKDKLQGIEVRCYSAGQTIPEDQQDVLHGSPEAFSKENEQSRRIEIRLTKLK